MNTTVKIIGGGVAIALVSVLATLGVQKIHVSFDGAQAPTASPVAAAPAPANPVVTPTPAATRVAQIISVSPHFETVKKPSRHCYPTQNTVYVAEQQQYNNPPVAGALLGGLTGGLLGSTARGRDRGLAIGGGAVLGAVAGGLIQPNIELQQQPHYVPQVEYSTRCVSKMVKTQVQKGYDVIYLYNGQQGFTRMEKEPVVNSLIVPPAVPDLSSVPAAQ